jgi:hypothetical protein
MRGNRERAREASSRGGGWTQSWKDLFYFNIKNHTNEIQ